MRTIWRSMRDEEPPTAGVSALLAAARAHAEAMHRPSWWQLLRRSLRRPPVLALASVMVLLAGALVIGHHEPAAEEPAVQTSAGASHDAPKQSATASASPRSSS